MDVGAFVDNGRVAVSRRKSQDSPKVTKTINGSQIVVELINVVDIARDRGELDNTRTCHWGHESHSQQMSSLRLHDALRCLRECKPDDDHKDGDRVDGDRHIVERHHDHGQGTQ